MTDDKTFDEILREEQAKLRQEESDAQDRLKDEREGVLRRSAALCYGALYQRFSAPDLTVESDFNESNSRIIQATAVLNGEKATAGSPAPAAAPTQSTSALPFDYDALPADKQRIMIMIAQDPQRFKEETIGEKVVLKDTHYASARAAIRRQQEAERAQEGGSDGSSSAPATPPPAKQTAAAKKATTAPPRSGATATEVQPPAPVQPPDAAQAPAPRSTPAPQQAAGTAPDDESEPDPETPSLMDRLKAAGKAAVENAKQ